MQHYVSQVASNGTSKHFFHFQIIHILFSCFIVVFLVRNFFLMEHTTNKDIKTIVIRWQYISMVTVSVEKVPCTAYDLSQW